MGVLGMTSFVDNNPHLLKTVKLHDIDLVIDGNNIYHFLYHRFECRVTYGGDYDTFANVVRDFISSMRECNIQPFVVLDGPQDKTGSKLRTQIHRASNKIKAIHSIVQYNSGKIIPLLVFDTFCLILEENGVPFVICDGEADAQIASVAKHKQCPVLSNDSDFYVFDVPNGFLVLDYFNFDVKSNDENPSHKFMEGEMYMLKNVLKKYDNLPSWAMAVVGTILGNDFIEPKSCIHFYGHSRPVNRPGQRKTVLKKRNHRIDSILSWLSNVTCISQAMDAILEHTKRDEREKLREKMLFSIEYYSKLPDVNDLCTDGATSMCTTTWRTYNGKEFPDWLVMAVRKGKLSPNLIGAAMNQRAILQHQIAKISEPSTFESSWHLRRIIYSILTSASVSDSTTKINIEEYDRHLKNLKKFLVECVSCLGNGRVLPSLNNVEYLAVEDRKAMFYECIGINQEIPSDVPSNNVFLFMVLFYWLTNSQPTLPVLCSVFLCYIKLKVCEILKWDDLEDKKLLFYQAFQIDSSNVKDDLKMADQCVPTIVRQKSREQRTLNIDIVHSLSQLQGCFLSAKDLNVILRSPFTTPAPHQFFNGTLLHNFASELSTKSNCLDHACEIIGRDNPLGPWLRSQVTRLISLVGEDSIGVVPTVSNAGKTNKKRKTKCVPTSVSHPDPETEEEDDLMNGDDSDDDERQCLQAYGLNNKFAMLEFEQS